MPGPTLAQPETMTGQFYDAEAISTGGGDWTPTRPGRGFARGVACGGTAGNVKVDCLGVGGSGGATGVTLPIAAGQTLQLCVTKVYQTGTTATSLVALY